MLVPGARGGLAGAGSGDQGARSARASASILDEPAIWPTESGHRRSESAEHDLQLLSKGSWRRMDEILCANYMVFHDVVREEKYDLWVGDEAWEIDYYLHEHPSEKRAALRLADRLRGLAADGGRRRARGVLTADYNAEMPITSPPTRRTRSRAVRRRPGSLRARPPGPAASAHPRLDRAELRLRRLRHGLRPDRVTATASGCALSSATSRVEQVCIVSVGGSGVGESLLRKVMAAYPAAREAYPI